MEKIVEALNPKTESDMDVFACSEATYCMEAYYEVNSRRIRAILLIQCKSLDLTRLQVAMKILVDNVAVLGIEHCLLEALQASFTAHTVMGLDNDVIDKIAAESQESKTERVRTREKLHILDDGLRILNRYRRSKHEGKEESLRPSKPATS